MERTFLFTVILMTCMLSCLECGYSRPKGILAHLFKRKLKMCHTALKTCKETADRLQTELTTCNQTLEECTGPSSPQCPDLTELFSGETGITITPKTDIVNSADVSCVNAGTGATLIFLVTCTQLADGSSLDWVNPAIPITGSQNLLIVVQDACNSPFGK